MSPVRKGLWPSRETWLAAGAAYALLGLPARAAGPGLSGLVDSSLVPAAGTANLTVSSAATGASRAPLAVVPVVEGASPCTYRYSVPELAPGHYLLTLSAAPAAGSSATPPVIAEARTEVGARPQVHDFAPLRVVPVGPARAQHTVASALTLARAGDVLAIDPGTYVDDIAVIRASRVTLRGIGERPHFESRQSIAYQAGSDLKNGKALWVVRGDGVRLENLELSGVRVPDGNGAAVRGEGRDLSICRSFLHDNENGFLGAAHGRLSIEYSEFARNGRGDSGRTHNVYVDAGPEPGDELRFRFNYLHHVSMGHQLKTRARWNLIAYNRMTDEADGNSSYAIDVPNGGLAFVIGNVLQKGVEADNSTLIAYGEEGLTPHWNHRLYVASNTLVGDRRPTVFVAVADGAEWFRLVNNLIVGEGTLVKGKRPLPDSNVRTDAPQFADRAAFDYRPVHGSPAAGRAVVVAPADGESLVPAYEYRHAARRRLRPASQAPDAGAFAEVTR